MVGGQTQYDLCPDAAEKVSYELFLVKAGRLKRNMNDHNLCARA